MIRHPAKFPETLVQEFIEFFTHRDQVVFDPMAGTGSALVAALRSGRHSYGIELNPMLRRDRLPGDRGRTQPARWDHR